MTMLSLLAFFCPACKPKSPSLDNPPNQSQKSPPPAQHPVSQSPTAAERNNVRCEWIRRTLQSGYQASGHTNSQWDKEVFTAFDFFAEAQRSRVSTSPGVSLDAALIRLGSIGCDDPLIQYLQLSHGHTGGSAATAARYEKVHDDILQSQYHPLVKFLVGLETVNHLRAADAKSDRSQRITLTTVSLMEAVSDTNAPSEAVCQAITQWLKHSSTPQWVAYVMDRIGPGLEAGWSQTEILPLIKGRGAIRAAWAERGNEYADKVTARGWQGFEENLAKAEAFLEQAWARNPNNAETAYLMMMVELGQGRGRARMQQWFDRAMQFDPNYYDAARQMSYYLQPRWYGSDESALEFARSCVTSTNWGGRVPLVLADLHRSLARYHFGTNQQPYWQQPAVWPDVKSSWEKFFSINSDTVGWQHDYAMDAYRCGHYETFLEQVAQFAGRTNYAFFGGEETFRKMLEKARAATNAAENAK